jgi:myo-inositol-1(or 4)-monophosphatase
MDFLGGKLMKYDFDDALLAAWDSARAGGAKLLEGYEESLVNRYNGSPFPEKDYERLAFESIFKIISEAFPEHPILTKKRLESFGGGFGEPQEGPLWCIDSLDGAFNYMRNNPFFSLSVSFLDNDENGVLRPLIGVILAPVLMEMFWATYKGGAFHVQQVPGIGLTQGPIYVSDAGKPRGAVVKTSLSHMMKEDSRKFRDQVRQMQEEVGALSHEASASLNMAYVAAGRVEGYFENKLNPISAAAGYLVVSEAGGKVSDYNGNPFDLKEPRDILVSNRILHDKFVAILGNV